MNVTDTRSARLAAAIGARGLTRQRLAELLGKPASAISAWAHEHPDRVRPTKGAGRGGQPVRVTTETIATALGVPPAALEVGGPWGPLVGEGLAVVQSAGDAVVGVCYAAPVDCEAGDVVGVRVTGARP